MDRFGDDLTELILQYLTFEDKVRLECVSKQWRMTNSTTNSLHSKYALIIRRELKTR